MRRAGAGWWRYQITASTAEDYAGLSGTATWTWTNNRKGSATISNNPIGADPNSMAIGRCVIDNEQSSASVTVQQGTGLSHATPFDVTVTSNPSPSVPVTLVRDGACHYTGYLVVSSSSMEAKSFLKLIQSGTGVANAEVHWTHTKPAVTIQLPEPGSPGGGAGGG